MQEEIENTISQEAEAVNTVPTEMITDEMREAGVDETTPLVTREEVVAEIGEEAVAIMEAEGLAEANIVSMQEGIRSEYMLGDFTPSNAPQFVKFYEKNEDGIESYGTTLEEMLRVSLARLNDLQSRFGCRENAIAITKMEEALMWLNKRTENRIARGVEGQHVA